MRGSGYLAGKEQRQSSPPHSLEAGSHADFISAFRIEHLRGVGGENGQQEVETGYKVSKAKDYPCKIQCSKTSTVTFQVRDPQLPPHPGPHRGGYGHVSFRSLCP